jgi:STE24 endopeptidase
MPHYLIVQLLFLIFFALHLAVERVLALLNSRYVYAHRDAVPEPVRDAISPETYAKSIDYALARARFGHVAALIGAAEVLFFLFSGFIGWLHEWIRTFQFSELTDGVVLLLGFMLIRTLIDLPLQLYSTFRLESRFGFNKTTPHTFWMDRIRGLLLSLVLGAPFAYGVLAFIMYSGSLWWLWASLFVIAFQAAMMVIVPIFIMPLFNKFTPLQDGELKSRLESLAQACRFAARGIFVMDGSKRSAHSNAYFTGLGKSRRIVLFDTLIAQLSTEELAAVLAHEIGHYKRKHIVQWLIVSSFSVFAGFVVLSLLIDWRPLYEAFNVGAQSKAVGVVVFMLISGTFTFWIGPLFSALSRQHEYEADAYAARQTSAEPMSTALLKLTEKNLGTLKPHPLYSAYHYSHPTTLERIGALRGK